MSLLNTFSNKTILELVIILESGDDYTSNAKEAAITILELRKVDSEELKDCATTHWKKQLKGNIKALLLVKEKPKSYFLNNEEITLLFKVTYNEWKENQRTFEVDTTKYWFV